MQDEMPLWSAYSYSFCNPVVFNDPSGMVPEDQQQQPVQVGFSGGKGTMENPIELSKFTVTAKRDSSGESSASGGWVDLSGLQLNRYEYSEDGFSDPMNYVKFADNVGVGIWNSSVGLGSAILNAEQTVRDIGDYFSEVGNYLVETSLSQMLSDTKRDFISMATDIQTYEQGVGALLTMRFFKPASSGKATSARTGVVSGEVATKGGMGLADDFLASAAKPWGEQGLSVVGRALQKHVGREGSVFQGVKFSHKTANQEGLNILNQIMNSPNKVIQQAKGGGQYIFDKTTGRGFGVSREGLFNGFRELPK